MTTPRDTIHSIAPVRHTEAKRQAACWLTRWRDQGDLPSFQRNSHFTLALLHAHVHEAGKRALRLRTEGDRAGSERALDEMEQALVDALELIDRVGSDARGDAAGRKPAASASRIAESVIGRLRCGGRPLRPAP